MPSGITHMMLSRKSLEDLQDVKHGKIADILNLERGAFIMGSVGPDLPYVPAFLPNNALADSFHTANTNKIPLAGLARARKLYTEGKSQDAKAVFALFVGYCSHLCADGIIHPFVRDMVGDYETAKVEHRTLEVKLDVVLADYFFDGDCATIDIHDELDALQDSQSEDLLYSSYQEVVNENFPGYDLDSAQVKRWVKGMRLMFEFTGSTVFPHFYRSMMGGKGLSHEDIKDIRQEKEKLIILKDPKPHDGKDLPHNFLQKETVNLIEDVIPMYFKVFPKIAVAAYEYVFEEGAVPTETILEINLDTGRLLVATDFNKGPAYKDLA